MTADGSATAETAAAADAAADATKPAGAQGELPAQVAALPAAKPGEAPVAPDGAAAQGTTDATVPPTGDATAAPGDVAPTTATAEQPSAEPAAAAAPLSGDRSTASAPIRKPLKLPSSDRDSAAPMTATRSAPAPAAQASTPVDPATAGDGSVVSAAPVVAAKPKPQGVLAAFFGSGGSSSSASRDQSLAVSARSAAKPAEPEKKRGSETIDLASLPTEEPEAVNGALPGVRQSALFEIKRRSGLDDDSDVDIYEEEDLGPIQIAAAPGMARQSPNGLLRQHESVDVACLKPSLVRVLKQVEQRYGRKMVVTSGYRSPSHNRRARGAKNSLHMYCAAADVQVPGVGKWELAAYVRSMPGRGGVGTYCHTNSVHIDVGPERDWNWRCRGRRKR